MRPCPPTPLISAVLLVFIWLPGSTFAQQPLTSRVRGVIESFDGHELAVRARSGDLVRLSVTEKTAIVGLQKIALSDIRTDAYVGVASVPAEQGPRVLSIHVFPEASRGLNEGSRAYDVRPNSSMTNGTLTERVKSVNGDELKITFKGGEKTVVVTPDSSVVRFEPGTISELQPGAKVVVNAVGGDASKGAERVLVGRDGLTPAL